MNLIGAHVAGGKNLLPGFTGGQAYGCEAIQVFLSSPHGFSPAVGDPELDAAFKETLEASGVKLYVHAPYVLNFGSPKPGTRASAATLLKSTMDRALAVGASGVVLHSGSSTGEPAETGFANVRASLLPLLDKLPEDSPPVLLEPMAGGGSQLAHRVDTLPDYFAAVDSHPKFGLCLDTAHLIAAGEALDEEGGATAMLDAVGAAVGFDRIELIHANDSKAPRGSKRDRHENLGLGSVHLAVWSEIFAHPEITCPLILETPGEGHRNDLALLKQLRG